MVALGRLGLAIPLRVGKNEEPLCVAATTDTFPRFTSPQARELDALAGVRLKAI